MTARPQYRRRARIVLQCLCVAVTASLYAAEDHMLEAKVKAAYLFNLLRFVDWPGQPGDAIRICVLGNSAIGGMLRELPAPRVRELPLLVETDAAVIPANCQLLFIDGAMADWQPLLAQLHGTSVLTVSDRVDFARTGGIVGFYRDDARVKLEINTSAALNANLKISSSLLELARKVP